MFAPSERLRAEADAIYYRQRMHERHVIGLQFRARNPYIAVSIPAMLRCVDRIANLQQIYPPHPPHLPRLPPSPHRPRPHSIFQIFSSPRMMITSVRLRMSTGVLVYCLKKYPLPSMRASAINITL